MVICRVCFLKKKITLGLYKINTHLIPFQMSFVSSTRTAMIPDRIVSLTLIYSSSKCSEHISWLTRVSQPRASREEEMGINQCKKLVQWPVDCRN